MDESHRDREILVEGTDSFLESQLEQAKRRLVETEQRREQYRRRYAGELPTQIETNLQGVQSRQLQVQAILESVDRDQERRLLAERQLAELESARPLIRRRSRPPLAQGGGSTTQRLNAARAQQAQMLLTLRSPSTPTSSASARRSPNSKSSSRPKHSRRRSRRAVAPV